MSKGSPEPVPDDTVDNAQEEWENFYPPNWGVTEDYYPEIDPRIAGGVFWGDCYWGGTKED